MTGLVPPGARGPIARDPRAHGADEWRGPGGEVAREPRSERASAHSPTLVANWATPGEARAEERAADHCKRPRRRMLAGRPAPWFSGTPVASERRRQWEW